MFAPLTDIHAINKANPAGPVSDFVDYGSRGQPVRLASSVAGVLVNGVQSDGVISDAADKLLYLALRNISKEWTMPPREWKAAPQQLWQPFQSQRRHLFHHFVR